MELSDWASKSVTVEHLAACARLDTWSPELHSWLDPLRYRSVMVVAMCGHAAAARTLAPTLARTLAPTLARSLLGEARVPEATIHADAEPASSAPTLAAACPQD